MTHIVANPPPAAYHVPTLTNFSVHTTTGQADVLAWGFPPRVSSDEYMIALAGTGYDGENRVVSEPKRWPYPNLVEFQVSDLRAGDRIAVYRNSNFGTPWKENWVQHSAAVKVDHVAADSYAARLASGHLPSYAHNANIKFYPFGALHRRVPVAEDVWMASVITTLDTMRRTRLGSDILRLLPNPTIIYPWVRAYQNANSSVKFSPQDFPPTSQPGANPDEILFHEFIHVIEGNYWGYSDSPGFQFDKADFLSVNATNVYSCLLGRGLRKDHHGFSFLPHEYFTNPRTHFDSMPGNYGLAQARAPALYNLLKSSSPLWNPFIFEPASPHR